MERIINYEIENAKKYNYLCRYHDAERTKRMPENIVACDAPENKKHAHHCLKCNVNCKWFKMTKVCLLVRKREILGRRKHEWLRI